MEQCPYCKEFEEDFFEVKNQRYGNRILFESDNFVVFPSLGQIVEGYLLIASKAHYIGIGQVPQEFYQELDLICQRVREVLSNTYGAPLFFEHGPISDWEKGGCCIAHAHIHAVPVKVDVLSELAKHFRYKRINSFNSLKKQFETGIPYLFYESNSGERYLFGIPEIVPSQYVRQIIAANVGRPEQWDWRIFPGTDKLLRTINTLKDKFK